ncbi:hypothetical protein RQP46_003733 [Phenoliferia psychrophenolica]
MSAPVTGGCFCGSVRYTLTIPASFKPEPHSCECTQCRKAIGGLFPIFLTVPTSALSFAPTTTRKVWASSATAERPLTWRDSTSGAPDEIELQVGTLDPEVLFGDKARLELVTPVRNLYCVNEIKGVTDGKKDGVRKFRTGGDGPEYTVA